MIRSVTRFTARQATHGIVKSLKYGTGPHAASKPVKPAISVAPQLRHSRLPRETIAARPAGAVWPMLRY
jgi:hypothetical protein